MTGGVTLNNNWSCKPTTVTSVITSMADKISCYSM
jgi:hypothetical protein